MTEVTTLVLSDSPLSREEVDSIISRPELLRSDAILRRKFPQLATSARVSDFQLPVRVHTALDTLRRKHELQEITRLDSFTIGQLLRIKNFGCKSMVDLLSSVRPVIVNTRPEDVCQPELNWPSSIVTAAAEHLRAQPYSARIRGTDPRFGQDVCTLLAIANASSAGPPVTPSSSLQAIAHLLVGRKVDQASPETVLATIKKIRMRATRAGRLTLEKELREVASAFVRGRNIDVVVSFFGWSGGGTKTLQIVGDEFCITRERVRQITTSFTNKIEATHPFLPTLRRAIGFVSRRLPAAEQEIERALLKAGLTQAHFKPSGILSGAELLGAPVPFDIEEHGGARVLIRHEDAGLTGKIISLARRTVSHAGLAKVAELRDLLQDVAGTEMAGASLAAVLTSLASTRWLDSEKQWFTLTDTTRNHLITLVKKVLSVAPRIHVNEMRIAIADDYRGTGFAPPKHVVMQFCASACECALDGDMIVACHPPDKDDVLSPTERLAYTVLEELGTPLLHRTDFERECVARGMNPSTFANYVGRLHILARYGPGVYGLRGAAVQPGDVERCSPVVTKRFRDHGWTDDAKPWLAVELSAASISSGVITVPAIFSRFVQGKYLARTQDGSIVGTVKIADTSGWGFKPLFSRRGGEPGDILLLTFDVQHHEVALRFGAAAASFLDQLER